MELACILIILLGVNILHARFIYQSGGFYFHVDWVRGAEYFLSPSVAGLIITEPAIWNVGEVRQSLGWGTDRKTGFVQNADQVWDIDTLQFTWDSNTCRFYLSMVFPKEFIQHRFSR